MPVKIRLQRHGKKGKPFYWIIAADVRAARDGKYLEKLGIYNPNTNPATIELDVDGTVTWLQNGAQPTDTARAILSYKGVLIKNHLAGGVRKGAITEEQAAEKFQAWLDEKEGKVSAKKDTLSKAGDATKQKAFEAEKAANEKRGAAAAEAVAAEEAAAAEVVAAAEAAKAQKVAEAEAAKAPKEEAVAKETEAEPAKEADTEDKKEA
jgi:small subunit ribosomal protein S16